MKTEMDRMLNKFEEAHEQLKQAKAKETEASNQLQEQIQKVHTNFYSRASSHTHRMSCCRGSVMQWRLH